MPSFPRPVALLAAVLSVLPPAAAQEWQGSGEAGAARAAYTQKGRPAGIQFECAPGGAIRTLVAGNGAKFPEGRDLTLVLSVDGVARVTAVRAEAERVGTGSRFVRTDPVGDLADFLAALKRGKELEVSSPAGQLRLPLKGSGKAIARLETGCGG